MVANGPRPAHCALLNRCAASAHARTMRRQARCGTRGVYTGRGYFLALLFQHLFQNFTLKQFPPLV